MILQSLKEYYERKIIDPNAKIAPEGFESKLIPFLIVIDEEGNFINLEFTGDSEAYHKGKPFTVPMWKQKSGKDSWKTTNFLWDHSGYVLGLSKGDIQKDIGQAKKQNETFRKMINLTQEIAPDNLTIKAISNFYLKDQISKVLEHEMIDELKSINGCNLSFRINLNLNIAPQDNELVAIADFWSGREFISSEEESFSKGICLVTGADAKITRLHRPISGINKKPSPMLAVNNLESPAFASYNKKQGDNFPVSEDAAFKYATALNFLLSSSQKIRIGDVVIVFWSERQSSFELSFSSLVLGESSKDNPDALTETVKALYKSLETGAMPAEESKTKFFVLGLSPNAARISVRFWQTGTIYEFSQKIVQHFKDLEIEHASHEKGVLSIWQMLKAIAVQGKIENIPSNLAGDWIRTILTGLPYPDSLFQMALRKIKLPRDEKKYSTKFKYEIEVQYPCVAILKACLNRKARFHIQSEKEITMSLDRDNRNIGYRLGRLFATLEKIQEKAQPEINATIRDRYYSAASSTPGSVLPIIMRLKNYHLSKISKVEKGFVVHFERLIGEIMDPIFDFPLQLNLQDQGRFAIGYYQQRQEFFKKSETNPNPEGE